MPTDRGEQNQRLSESLDEIIWDPGSHYAWRQLWLPSKMSQVLFFSQVLWAGFLSIVTKIKQSYLRNKQKNYKKVKVTIFLLAWAKKHKEHIGMKVVVTNDISIVFYNLQNTLTSIV